MSAEKNSQRSIERQTGDGCRPARSSAGGWGRLILALGLFWVLAQVVLPWGQGLPGLKPVMLAIQAADVDVTTYWYSQSEITAEAENYIRNTLRHL